jgi:hypothetical protein
MSLQNKAILSALSGILFIILYFILIENSELAKFLLQKVSKDEVVQKAEQIYKKSSLNEYDLSRDIKVSINNELSEFAQRLPDSDPIKYELPVATFGISWKGKSESTVASDVNISFGDDEVKTSNIDIFYSLDFDFRGKMRGFEKNLPAVGEVINLTESEAESQARMFLLISGYDTSRVSLREKFTDKKGK